MERSEEEGQSIHRPLSQLLSRIVGGEPHFDLFLSSCFFGVTKPEEAIYRTALHVTQHEPDACVFIDDRELNVETAAALGIRTIHYQGPEQLRRELESLGIAVREGT